MYNYSKNGNFLKLILIGDMYTESLQYERENYVNRFLSVLLVFELYPKIKAELFAPFNVVFKYVVRIDIMVVDAWKGFFSVGVLESTLVWSNGSVRLAWYFFVDGRDAFKTLVELLPLGETPNGMAVELFVCGLVDL